MKKKVDILSGAYGTTILHDPQFGAEGLNAQTRIGQRAHAQVARQFMEAGATQIQNPLFGLRERIAEGISDHEIRDIIGYTITGIGDGIGMGEVNRGTSLGPFGDCYATNDGYSVKEAQELYEQQVRFLQEHPYYAETVGTVVYETIPHAKGAIAAIKASIAAKLKLNEFVVSLTLKDGKLFNGQRLGDAVEEIVATTGIKDGLQLGLNCFAPKTLPGALDELRARGYLANLRYVFPNASNKDPDTLCGCNEFHGVEDPGLYSYLTYVLADPSNNVTAVSGCCGFLPEDVAQIVACAKSFNTYQTPSIPNL